jgi:hypothetical protein
MGGHEDLTNPVDVWEIPPSFKGTKQGRFFISHAANFTAFVRAGNGMAGGARPVTMMFTTIITHERGGIG